MANTATVKLIAKFQDGMSPALKKLVTGARAVAAAFAAFAVTSISAASQVEETMGKFSAVFKDQAGRVERALTGMAAATQRSKFDLFAFAATLQDTFVPLGFARDVAADMSIQLVQLAVDLASFNNIPTAQVVMDLQSALVGNVETLRKYGVAVNQSSIQTFALTNGLWSGTAAITAQEKAAAILGMTIEGTSDAQGDAERTSDSFANQMRGLGAAIKDLQVNLGQALLPVLSSVVGGFAELLRDSEKLEKILEAVETATIAATTALISYKGAALVASDASFNLLGVWKHLRVGARNLALFLSGPGGVAVAAVAVVVALKLVLDAAEDAQQAIDEATAAEARNAEVARAYHIAHVKVAQAIQGENIPALIALKTEVEGFTSVTNTSVNGLDDINAALASFTDESYDAAIAQLELAKAMLAGTAAGSALETALDLQIAKLQEARDVVVAAPAAGGVEGETDPLNIGASVDKFGELISKAEEYNDWQAAFFADKNNLLNKIGREEDRQQEELINGINEAAEAYNLAAQKRFDALNQEAERRSAIMLAARENAMTWGQSLVDASLQGEEAVKAWADQVRAQLIRIASMKVFGLILSLFGLGGVGDILGKISGIAGGAKTGGGHIPGAAGGMVIPGAGVSDSVLVMATPRERILTERQGQEFDRLRQGGDAGGGISIGTFNFGPMFSDANPSQVARSLRTLERIQRKG